MEVVDMAIPASVSRDGGAPQERREEADDPHNGDLAPFPPHDRRLQFRPGQEGEDHGPGGGQESHPGLV
jgi:hypothetical protein